MMKLTTCFLLACCLHVSARSVSQTVTVVLKQASLKKVFREIESQTPYVFWYDDQVLKTALPVTVNLKNADIKNALNQVLASQQLTYSIEANVVVISRKPAKEKRPDLSYFTTALAPIELQGRVTDSTGAPLAGASVTVKGTRKGTQTDANGKFTLKDIGNTAVLVVAYAGFEEKELTVSDARPGSLLQVTLAHSNNPLDRVQVIAYGSTTRRFSTGSVSSVKSEDLQKQPVSNPLQALSGRVAGVFVTETAGVAGSNVTMQIRGQNTIAANATPLYIVDGVPFNGNATEGSTGTYSITTLTGGTLSPFDNIPTADIESIEVLKDADATAIYGSRAANGVVIITTKRGQPGTMKLGANIYTGIAKITRQVEMLHTEQYLNIRKQAFANDNITPTAANAPDLLTFGNGYTDYVSFIMGNEAKLTDATLDLSGGSRLTQYLVSANYRHQSSIFPRSFADKKATVRFNLQSQSENGKLRFNLSGGYTKNNNNLPTAGVNTIYTLPPNLPVYNNDGSYYWHASYNNPAAALLAPSTLNTDNLLANSTIQYKILPGLNFKTDLGFNRIEIDMTKATTKASRNPITATTGSITLQNNYTQTYSVEPQLNYTVPAGPGKLDVLLGGTYQASKSIQSYFILGSFTNDALYTSLGAITPFITESGYAENKYLSAFARINYNIKGKYVLNFNGRRDGSSRFGADRRFGNFGSAGAAWIFTQEKFMESVNWLSFGKLRGSYGTTGNSPNSDYRYISTYSSSGFTPAYNGVSALTPVTLSNKMLAWDLIKKLGLATDLNFFNDRISFTAGWYRNLSTNLLVTIPVAFQSGFGSYLGNLDAKVENKGWEFTLETKNVARRNFSWRTGFNITISRNKLLSYPGLEQSVYANSYVVGHSLGTVQAYHFTGFKNGMAEVQDLDGNGSITTGSFPTTGKGDQTIAGTVDPRFYGGFSNTIQYKGFQLDFLFSFVKKMGYNIYNSLAAPGNAGNVAADVLNYPFAYTTLTTSPAATAFNYYKASDAAFGDASFVRLKNVSLTYSFTEKQLGRTGLKQLNLYLRGQNLLTFTKYLGYDPETLGVAIPPMKIFTIGLQTSL